MRASGDKEPIRPLDAKWDIDSDKLPIVNRTRIAPYIREQVSSHDHPLHNKH